MGAAASFFMSSLSSVSSLARCDPCGSCARYVCNDMSCSAKTFCCETQIETRATPEMSKEA